MILIYNIIDSHIHLFPEKLMRAIQSFFWKNYGWKLPFPAKPEQLLAQVLAEGAESCFALAYSHKPGLSRSLNSWLAGFCRKHSMVVPFGAAHPADHDLPGVVREALDQYRFPGLKRHCLVQQCRPDDARLFPLYQAVVERSKVVIVHAGSFPQPSENNLGIAFVANLLDRFPTLKLIVPHMGLNDLPAYSGLLTQYDGLYLDTAFVFQNEMIRTPEEEIRSSLEKFPERILYGSDFPFILEPPQNGLKRILDLKLPEDNYRRLFYRNAINLLDSIPQ